MRRFSPALALAGALAATLAACDGGGSTLPDLTPETARMTVVSGDAQVDTVTRLLSTAVLVRVGDDRGRVREGVRVDFVVVEPGCGRPFTGSALTNEAGEARERWELGTKAGLCHLEARAVDPETGAPLVLARLEARVLPDEADTVQFLDDGPTFRPNGAVHAVPLLVGQELSLSSVFYRAADRYGNVHTDPQLTWRSTPPLAPRGDERYDAAAEGIGRIYPAAARTDTLHVLSLHSLAGRWSAAWTCRAGRLLVRQPGGTVDWAGVDSIRMTLAVDSVRYTGAFETGFLASHGVASYQAEFHGRLGFTLWWADGQVQTNATGAPRRLVAFDPGTPGPWAGQLRRAWQYPGGLHTVTGAVTPANLQARWVATRTGNPARYEGGGAGWCWNGMENGPSSFRLTRAP
ncbi:MAG TPA: hypothetical protein VHG91_19375 [Longimicrobium sp.]|nr:hypothetical protein [Longimicrobium sp.]